jgi:hypothetical protein
MMYVEKYNFRVPDGAIEVNTPSRSDNWSKDLSPFYLPGGYLYGNFYAENVENAWQASKVYPEFDDNGKPSLSYFD